MLGYFEEIYSSSDCVSDLNKCIKIENFFSLIREGKKEEVESYIQKKPEALFYTNNLRQNALHIASEKRKPEIKKKRNI